MKPMKYAFLTAVAVLLTAGPAQADKYSETVDLFKNAGESGDIFKKSYGYAVFPTIGKAGLGVGGAYGEGRVYEKGKYVGDSKMTQLSIGFQAGGEGYSQIVFLEDKRAFDEFTSGDFEFGANVNAIVITAAAGVPPAQPAPRGPQARASTTRRPPASSTRAPQFSSYRRAA